jgi:hypothetical protein
LGGDILPKGCRPFAEEKYSYERSLETAALRERFRTISEETRERAETEWKSQSLGERVRGQKMSEDKKNLVNQSPLPLGSG